MESSSFLNLPVLSNQGCKNQKLLSSNDIKQIKQQTFTFENLE